MFIRINGLGPLRRVTETNKSITKNYIEDFNSLEKFSLIDLSDNIDNIIILTPNIVTQANLESVLYINLNIDEELEITSYLNSVVFLNFNVTEPWFCFDLSDNTTLYLYSLECLTIDYNLSDIVPIDLNMQESLCICYNIYADMYLNIDFNDPCFYFNVTELSLLTLNLQENIEVGVSLASNVESVINIIENLEIDYNIQTKVYFCLNAGESIGIEFELIDYVCTFNDIIENIEVDYYLTDNMIVCLNITEQLIIDYLLTTDSYICYDLTESIYVEFDLQDYNCTCFYLYENITDEALLINNLYYNFYISEQLEITFNLSDNIITKFCITENLSFCFNLYDSVYYSVGTVENITIVISLNDILVSNVNIIENLTVLASLTDALLLNSYLNEQISICYQLIDSLTYSQTLVNSISIGFNITENISLNLSMSESITQGIYLNDTAYSNIVLQENLQISFNLNDIFISTFAYTDPSFYFNINSNVSTVIVINETLTIQFYFIDNLNFNFSLKENLQVILNLNDIVTSTLIITETLYYEVALRDIQSYSTYIIESLNSFTTYESEASALIARFSVYPNYKIREAINTYIKGLKDNNIWIRLDLLYVLAAPDQQSALLNWVSTKYNGSIVGSPTFTALRGFTGAGKGYIETGMSPGASVNLYKQDDSFMAIRTLNTVADAIADFGIGNSYINSRRTILPLVYLEVLTNNTSTLVATTSSGTGGFSWSRTSNLNASVYINGVNALVTISLPSATPSSDTFKVCGSTIANSTNTQMAVVAAGASLTDSQVNKFNLLTDAYLSSVGAI